MKLKGILWGALSLLLLNACASYYEAPPPWPVADKPLAVEHVSVEKACSILNGIISSPAVQENATRGVTVSPSNVTAYTAAGELLTRADNDEARYYLVDIPELEMYAIMGAHTTVPPLLVLANGSANTPEEQEEDELKNYIANLPNTPENWLITDPVPIDTTLIANQYTVVYDYANTTFTLLNGITPVDMKWGQKAPYNMRCPDGVNPETHNYFQHARVCCGALAMAMVLTHPKYRPNIRLDNHKLDWQRMWNFKYENYVTLYPGVYDDIVENHISLLLDYLSSPYMLNIEWGEDVSTCNPNDVKWAFRKLGIKCEENSVAYDVNLLKSEISQGYPLLIYGYTTQGGHMWVCSAVLKAAIPYKIVPVVKDPDFEVVIDSGLRTFNLLHHNWGWAKKNTSDGRELDYNGYYLESDTIVSGKGLKYDDDFGLVINKPNGWGAFGGIYMWVGVRNSSVIFEN